MKKYIPVNKKINREAFSPNGTSEFSSVSSCDTTEDQDLIGEIDFVSIDYLGNSLLERPKTELITLAVERTGLRERLNKYQETAVKYGFILKEVAFSYI